MIIGPRSLLGTLQKDFEDNVNTCGYKTKTNKFSKVTLIYGVIEIIYILIVVGYMALYQWWLHEYASQTFNYTYRACNWPRALAAEPRNPSSHLNQCYISMSYSQTITGHSKDIKAGPLWKILRRLTPAQTPKGLAHFSFLRLPIIQGYSQLFFLLLFTWIRLALWSDSSLLITRFALKDNLCTFDFI